MLIRTDTLKPWAGETLNDLRHPLNIEALWADADLAAIGLKKPIPFVVPSGKVTSGAPTYLLNAGGDVIETYAVQDPPPPSAAAVRQQAFAAEPDRVDLANRLETATPAQIDTWIDTNVTTIVASRAVLKAIIKRLVAIEI